MRSFLSKKIMIRKLPDLASSVLLPLTLLFVAALLEPIESRAQTASNSQYTVNDGAGGGTGEYIQNLKYSNGPAWGISFYTSSVKRMTLRGDKLGIGTDNPIKPFHIRAGSPYVRFEDTGGGNAWDVGAAGDLGEFRIYEDVPGGSQVRFLIKEGGNVGIGLQPVTKLDVAGTLRVREGISIANYTEIGHENHNGYINRIGLGRLDFRIGGSTRMSLANNGNFGIGTLTPEYKLDVNGHARAHALRGVDANNSANEVFISHGGSHGYINKIGAGNLDLRTDGTTQMTLTNAGQVGIGTSSPSEKLEVAGFIKAEGLVLSTATDNNLHLRSTSVTTSVTGYDNTNVGADAGLLTTSGSYNSNIGSRAGRGVTTGSYNTNIGWDAGYSTGNGGYNVYIGAGTGRNVADKNGNVMIGTHAGEGVTEYDYSVFIGYNAGVTFSNTDLDQDIAAQTVTKKSLFIVNNKANIEHPLLFGYFGETTNPDSEAQDFVPGTMSQLGINTHELVDSCALTVKGAVHIGPFDNDPNTFDYDEMIKDYLLWVERGVVSEDFIIRQVEAWDDWPDYVFHENFNLPSLKNLKEYIAKNKHLPGVISQDEIKKTKGYSVIDLDKQLLRKVEELTLYAIQQEERLEAQSKQLDLLMAELEKLKSTRTK